LVLRHVVVTLLADDEGLATAGCHHLADPDRAPKIAPMISTATEEVLE
jgi:hypothetical protein